MIVVADTGPVNYLVLSGQVDLAHHLYGTLLMPPAVHRELLDTRAPAADRGWVDFTEAVSKLRSTGIFLSDEILQDALDRHQDRHTSDPGKL